MFETVIEPRVCETDGVGHINNTTIPIWFESGRQGIFRIFNPDLSFKDWRCVIIKMNVEYIAQLYYGQPVKIRTWISRIGNSSFEVYEEMEQEGQICAKGNSTYVNFNRHTQRSESISAPIKNKLQEHFYEEPKEKG
ncbi:acyl-CoA thioesterase [Halalkalibacter nanhaiisediminis]|uniref:Acyl-CoA thioester hydrolase n=1 Tax=Halalkalibacter nanhaiisediminis TaxID=688079 RepID=A0A562QRE3_9BACI|nr:thioesterase family protein [Halalkalibacter nanhaiisediminis]TWI59265.1 acyl-CoA thioester hydrolase [Halalkalibacter nanhaiisediminis]